MWLDRIIQVVKAVFEKIEKDKKRIRKEQSLQTLSRDSLRGGELHSAIVLKATAASARERRDTRRNCCTRGLRPTTTDDVE